MPTLTTRRGFSKPSLSDPANVPSDVATFLDAVDAQFGSVIVGVLASRPASGKDGDVYWARDDATLGPNGTPHIWDATASAWHPMGLSIGAGPNQAVAGNDARMTDARVPLAHAATHQEGAADDIGAAPIGAILPYTGSVLPAGGKWDWADGALIDKTTYATFFNRTGHAYNGGVDPGSNKVRKPDKRGRVPMGADSFGQGAANRIVTGNKALGQNGGSERVQLLATESGVPAHGHPITDPWHHHDLPDHSHSVGGGGYMPSYDANAKNLVGINGASPYGFSVGATNAGGWFGWTTGTAGSSNLGMYNQGTGISINNNTAASAGSSHQNLQPYEADNYIVRIA